MGMLAVHYGFDKQDVPIVALTHSVAGQQYHMTVIEALELQVALATALHGVMTAMHERAVEAHKQRTAQIILARDPNNSAPL
jgi:hypothetical protein